MDSNKFMASTIEELIKDPAKYGAPTFAEFCKNPDKFRKSKEQMLTSADKGSQVIAGIKKHIYYVEGYRCDSPEKAQLLLNDMGLTEDMVTMKVELEDMKNGEVRAHVFFNRKSNLILPEGM